MLRNHGVKSLYPLALAEGEGIGTAYEYVAKRNVLQRWLEHRPTGRLLVAGLPEVYGCSLDYLLLAEEFKMPAVIADDRTEFLYKADSALRQAQVAGWLTGLQVDFVQVGDLSRLSEINTTFGWCICNEVLQRFDQTGQAQYLHRLAEIAPLVTVFAPNADNTSHTTVSGLAGLKLDQMKQLVISEAGAARLATGYCDMPPFPPGISRSDEQREQAGHGKLEAVAMWGLSQYAGMERFLPRQFKHSRAHIVYGLSSNA